MGKAKQGVRKMERGKIDFERKVKNIDKTENNDRIKKRYQMPEYHVIASGKSLHYPSINFFSGYFQSLHIKDVLKSIKYSL